MASEQEPGHAVGAKVTHVLGVDVGSLSPEASRELTEALITAHGSAPHNPDYVVRGEIPDGMIDHGLTPWNVGIPAPGRYPTFTSAEDAHEQHEAYRRALAAVMHGGITWTATFTVDQAEQDPGWFAGLIEAREKTVQVLDQNSDEEITALLLGRRIVTAEMRAYGDADERWDRPDGRYGDPVEGRLVLDDGTVLLVVPNDGGCACSAGDYHLTDLATCDNVITAVQMTAEPHPEHPDDDEACSYRIYVYAEDVKINAVQVDGDDGNGYYGTGFELLVIPA